MKAGSKFAGIVVLGFCVLSAGVANAATQHTQKKSRKPQAAPLPSGPTGPVQQIPLDSIAPVAPQVSYQEGQLTIVAPNSTLGDILRAVRKQTGAEIEVPSAPERVVTHLGPGPARDVVAELLNGSRFNYVLLGSPADESLLTRVVLVAKSASDTVRPSDQVAAQPQSQPVNAQAGYVQPPPQQVAADANEPEAQEEATDDAADQAAAEAEQPAGQEQPGVKTPQQMLQEMQQRQLQMQQQQQQQPGQPYPGGMNPPPQRPEQ